jgi:hypothetical protein
VGGTDLSILILSRITLLVAEVVRQLGPKRSFKQHLLQLLEAAFAFFDFGPPPLFADVCRGC